MDKVEITFHVGFPKTCSTFLQRNVFSRIENINYYDKQSFPIAYRLNKKRIGLIHSLSDLRVRKDELQRELLRFIDTDKPVLISNEYLSIGRSFFYVDKVDKFKIAERLFDMFPDAKIIVGTRNIKKLIISLYRQYIFAGGAKSFRDFVSDDLLEAYQPETYLEFLKYLFGESNVFIFQFIYFKENPHLVIDNICRFLNTKAPPNVSVKSVNAGFGKRQIEVSRKLNGIFKTRLEQEGIPPVVISDVYNNILKRSRAFGYERYYLQQEDNRWLDNKINKLKC
jgi:hypothetical protein